jgi:hypothetical protein
LLPVLISLPEKFCFSLQIIHICHKPWTDAELYLKYGLTIDEIAFIESMIKPMDFGKMRLKIYVFSPGRYPFTDNFREVEDKVELVALPAAIYDAYQKVLPKRKEKLFEEEKEQVETKIPADLFFAERSDLEVEREGQGAL